MLLCYSPGKRNALRQENLTLQLSSELHYLLKMKLLIRPHLYQLGLHLWAGTLSKTGRQQAPDGEFTGSKECFSNLVSKPSSRGSYDNANCIAVAVGDLGSLQSYPRL